MELVKYLNLRYMTIIANLLNRWLAGEEIDEEVTIATVTQIYKSGSTQDPANYRPISLLNSIYKLYTAIIQERLADCIDPYLQDTQYGFRKHRSTTTPLHAVRAAASWMERTGFKTLIVCLDWEKAFDKINQEAITYALNRMNVDAKVTLAIKNMHKHPRFNTVINEIQSSWHDQERH